MSSKKTKLELTWIGKEHRPKLEPRILLEEPDKSHHAKFRVKESPQENAENAKGSDSLRSLRSFAANEVGDIFDNRLIRGDNLLGLKALEQKFALTMGKNSPARSKSGRSNPSAMTSGSRFSKRRMPSTIIARS